MKGSGDTKTVQTGGIDPELKPYIVDFTKSLTGEYDRLKGLNPVPDFQTYVGPSQQTSDALGNISQLARQGNPYQAATQYMFNTGAQQYGDIYSNLGRNAAGYNDLAATGGFNPGMGMAQTAAQGGLYNANTAGITAAMNGGLYNTTNPMLQGIAEGSLANQNAGMATTVAHGGLYNTDRQLFDSFINGGRAITAGNLVGDMAAPGASNPYLDSMFGRAADQVQGRVQGAMNRNGNLNSSFNQAGMQDALSGLATNIYGGQYQQGQQNRLAAAGLMGQFQGQNQQAALQAASQAAGTTAQDRDRQLAGVQLAVNTGSQDRDRQLQGASMLQNSVAQDRDRQFQGASAFANIGAQDRDRQMQGINQVGMLGQQNIQNRLNALQGQQGAYNTQYGALQGQQGLMSMMPGLNNARYDDARALAAAGSQAEGYQQNYINDLLNRFNTRRQGNIPLAQQVGSIFTGLAGAGQQSFAPVQGPDRLGQGIGALSTLGGAWILSSSRDFKEKVGDAPDVLAALESLPVEAWRYKEDVAPGGAVHIGPYAQDVQKALGIGDGQGIPVVSMMGAMLKGIQELSASVKTLAARVEQLEAA